LQEAGAFLGIRLLDHVVIVSAGRYTRFMERGLRLIGDRADYPSVSPVQRRHG